MSNPKRVLICEFHQETNTFNPIITPFERFHPTKTFEGEERYQGLRKARGMVQGTIDAIEAAGGVVIPSVFMHSGSGGRVADEVLTHLCERITDYAKNNEFDAIVASLHGATVTESDEDACGTVLEHLRKLAGDKPVAAAFDLHANITDKILTNADIICGYQTYPHVDIYQTGYRAAALCMELLNGRPLKVVQKAVPMLIPPAGYTNTDGPFKMLMDNANAMVANGTVRDYSIFAVQPWLDIKNITSRIITIVEDEAVGKRCAEDLGQQLWDLREKVYPPLVSVDEIIDAAEANTEPVPVLLAESADSPNGGCVGDSPVVAMRLLERGSKLKACTFIIDPEVVDQAFSVGVGNSAEFSVGAKFTPGMPGPLKAVGTVRALHDGYFNTAKYHTAYLGPTAVIRFGTLDVVVSKKGAVSGSPDVYRGVGINPSHYDLVVVKANTSFRAAYANISKLIYMADTHGAGASNLKLLKWNNLPEGIFPFDK